jgi:hypothetical protein
LPSISNLALGKEYFKILKKNCRVPDRGHSAKKRNKPPRRTFLLPSLISLSHCTRHPRAVVDSPPRRPPAAALAPRRAVRPPIAAPAPRARRHRRALPLTRAPCSPSPPTCSPCPRPLCSPCPPCPPCPRRRAPRHRRPATRTIVAPTRGIHFLCVNSPCSC